jgi:hypothetical protein
MDFHQNTFSILVFTCLFASILFASILPVSGVSIIMNSHTINPGEPVQVSILDLRNDSTFEMVTEGVYPVVPGESLHFQLNQFTLPFSLSQGEISISTDNTRSASFSVENAETIASIKASPENGTFSRREFVTIPSGMYSSISLEATPLSYFKPVRTTFILKGIKRGDNNANLSFFIKGIENGQVHITIKVNNIPQLNEVITIGAGGSPSSILSSSDGTAILTGSGLSSIQSLDLNPKNLPWGWRALSKIYQYVSADGNSSGTTLYFKIPADISTDPQKNTLFIARSANGSWVMMPSSIHIDPSGSFISTDVQQDGEYCLVSLGPPERNSAGWKLPLSDFAPLIAVIIAGLILIREKR